MKKILEHIDYTKPEHKEKMNELFIELLDDSMEYDKDMYDYAKCEIYELAYGKKISEEMADEWVNNLNPSGKWSIDEISNVVKSYNLGIPIIDAYIIMNMLYSDSSNVYGDGNSEESLEMYIDGTKDWYFDKDSYDGSEKLYNYWKYIVLK